MTATNELDDVLDELMTPPDDRFSDDEFADGEMDAIDAYLKRFGCLPDLDSRCNCGKHKEPSDHEKSCDLWWSVDFDDGWAEWDDDRGHLVLTKSAQEILDGMTYLDDKSLDDLAVEGDIPKGGTSFDDAAWGAELASYGVSYATTYKKCRHNQAELILQDGTVVYASSHPTWSERVDGAVIPDLGIYMDGIWEPDCLAFLVGCPDYGYPVPAPHTVLHVAREGLRIARDDGMVEVGCIGGHGRTGLMLSLMVLIVAHETGQTVDADQAVSYVRQYYCTKAVESEIQKWWLRGMACELQGLAWPPKPPPPPKPKYTVVSKKDDKKDDKKEEHVASCACIACWLKRKDIENKAENDANEVDPALNPPLNPPELVGAPVPDQQADNESQESAAPTTEATVVNDDQAMDGTAVSK